MSEYKRQNATYKIKVGDLFVNSWGYDQTNIDYYQVVGKTNKTIKLRAISSEVTEDGFMQGKSKPVKNSFIGEELRKTPYEYTGETCLGGVWVSFEFGAGKLWDGKDARCSWYA